MKGDVTGKKPEPDHVAGPAPHGQGDRDHHPREPSCHWPRSTTRCSATTWPMP